MGQLPMRESDIQRAVIQHWRVRGVKGSVVAHIPNGEYRPIGTARRLASLGTLPGMPDLFCASNGSVFFIELKRPGGRVSAAQKETFQALREAGVRVHVMSDLDEVIRLLEAEGVLHVARQYRVADRVAGRAEECGRRG